MTIADPETEFDIALARAGISLPPERRAAMYDSFLAWRAMRVSPREPLPHATEPAFGLRRPAPRR